MYPFRFHPIFREYLWGGRRLATELSKPIGSGDRYAESWEVVDRGDDQSVVAFGRLAGTTLHELVAKYGNGLLGPNHSSERFPLLLKFLDAREQLSVQVHPNDEQAAQLNPPDLGKTEAWVVLAADPQSVIYAGLRDGVDRGCLASEIAKGTTQSCLHVIHPRVGDCIFLPAGTVHAIGGGLLIAEIQQASDTTYRLFDWNRVDKDGRPRPLHIEQALDVIDFARGPINPQSPHVTGDGRSERLVACDKFVLDRWRLEQPLVWENSDEMRLLAVTDGSLWVDGDPAERPLPKGETMLIPAAWGRTSLRPAATAEFLEIRLP